MPMAVPQRLAPLALRLLYRLPKPTHWALASLLFKASINHFFAGCFLFLIHVGSKNSPAGYMF